MTGLYRLGKILCNIYCTLVYRVEVHGSEKLPKDRGLVLVCNHVTAFDPIFLALKLKRQLNFMAKAELFKNKLLGALLKGLGAFPVSRGTGDTTAIDKAVETVENGDILAIFPEGTRSKTGEMGRFKSGAVVIAQKTGADIVPASIYIEKFEKGLRFRSRVVIRFGEVIQNKALELESTNLSAVKKAGALIKDAVARLLEESKA